MVPERRQRAAVPGAAGGGGARRGGGGGGAGAAVRRARPPGAALHAALQRPARPPQRRRQQGMMVAPVLANLGPLEDVTLTPNPQEVEEVFTVPLAHLLQAQNQGYTHFRSKGRYSHTLPVFLNGPHRVWGLTAVITELTLELLAPDLYRRKTRVTGDR